MDKKKYTYQLVTDRSFFGIPKFRNGSQYVYCPLVPADPLDLVKIHGITLDKSGQIWLSFWKQVHEIYAKDESYATTIKGKDHTYNWNNGKTVIVVGDTVLVSYTKFIDFQTLEELGFAKDMELFVPLSNGEAYYSPNDDHGCNKCGLIY